MAVLTFDFLLPPVERTVEAPYQPPADWPLMGDVVTCRAGVPEALIRWRAERGETPPRPGDS